MLPLLQNPQSSIWPLPLRSADLWFFLRGAFDFGLWLYKSLNKFWPQTIFFLPCAKKVPPSLDQGHVSPIALQGWFSDSTVLRAANSWIIWWDNHILHSFGRFLHLSGNQDISSSLLVSVIVGWCKLERSGGGINLNLSYVWSALSLKYQCIASSLL